MGGCGFLGFWVWVGVVCLFWVGLGGGFGWFCGEFLGGILRFCVLSGVGIIWFFGLGWVFSFGF